MIVLLAVGDGVTTDACVAVLVGALVDVGAKVGGGIGVCALSGLLGGVQPAAMVRPSKVIRSVISR